MAVINPCGFLQNAGATHTAEMFRNWQGLLVAGKTGSTSLISRGGVNPALGNALQVTQTASPSMGVLVKSGHATIPGSEGSKQGIYSVMNDADVTLSISAAHATLNRLDLICFKVEDDGYSGAAHTSSLVVVAGTPASSPSLPTAPANSITLASVSIVALDTSITTGEITDRRTYMAALGGVISVENSTERDALTAYRTQLVYRRDTDKIEEYNGSSWAVIADPVTYTAWTSYTPTWTTQVSSPAVGNGTLVGRYKIIGKTMHLAIKLTCGTTTTFGTGYWKFSLPGGITTVAGGVDGGGTSMLLDSGTVRRAGTCYFFDNSNLTPLTSSGDVTSAVPQTWATGDICAMDAVVETT